MNKLYVYLTVAETGALLVLFYAIYNAVLR